MGRISGLVILVSVAAHAQSDTAQRMCRADVDCAELERCEDRQQRVEGKSWWVGLCVDGKRTEAHGPAPISTREGPPRSEYTGKVPPGYALQSVVDARLLAPGVVLFAAFYAAAQLPLLGPRANAWSLVPIAGPLIQFYVDRDPALPMMPGELNLAVISTVGQALSVAAIVVGLVKPVQWLEPLRVTVAPSPGGIALVGAF